MKVLDPNERKELWNQIDEASRKLGVPSLPKLHIGMKVEKGDIVLCDQREEGHSWTRTGWNWLFAHMSNCAGDDSGQLGAGKMSSTNTYGTTFSSTAATTTRYTAVTSTGGGFINNSTSNTYGLVVGTDDTAMTLNDYQLGTIIANGTGSGELSYQAMVAPSINYASNIWTASVARMFNNNSGDTITVKEIGLYWGPVLFNSSGQYNFMVARDVLGSPVSVVNGAQLTVTYEISMDFSSIDT